MNYWIPLIITGLIQTLNAQEVTNSNNDNVNMEYPFRSTVLNEDNEVALANYFGNVPLCSEDAYFSCVEHAKSGLEVCSAGNKGCQCYVAGASIVECSQYCSSYNLNSFMRFKNVCGSNPYILNYNEQLYSNYDSNSKKSQSLIKELQNYRYFTSQEYSSISNTSSKRDLELRNAIFDFSSVAPSEVIKQNPKVINGNSDLKETPSESESFQNRLSYETKKLQLKHIKNKKKSKDLDGFKDYKGLNHSKEIVGDYYKNNSSPLHSSNKSSINGKVKSNSTSNLNFDDYDSSGLKITVNIFSLSFLIICFMFSN